MNAAMEPSQDGIDINLDESLVYQELADIRSSFEKLIDRYGFESIEEIMPKVVTVLEQFEELASYRRQAKLKLANSELRLEETKEIHNSEMRQQRARLGELQEHCVILQEENAELRRRLKTSARTSQPSNPEHSRNPQQEEVMLKLSDVIAVQQRKINEMREEYDVLNQHSNKQSTIVLKLKSALQETMHAQRVLHSRNDTLCAELANLEASIAAQELKGDYNFRDRERSDSCTQSEDRSWDSFEELKKRDECIPEDPDIVAAKKEYKRSAAQVIRETLSSYSPSNRRKNKCTCEQSKFRFNVDEMTLLINERNILKERVFTLEEDLSYYKEEAEEADDPVTDEGFALLEPPLQSHLTRTLFKRISQNDVST